jgi:F420-dependent oxidoreductase-like protein
MRVCLMVEGQEGVSWDQWVALANACEDNGLEALFRSDHYLSFSDPTGRGSLDAWATLAGLAATTTRIKLGTMVSPVTFRHPSNLAKTVATVDHISNGRVELGIGAGWFADEHQGYGFDFPETPTRIEMLEEQIEIVNRQWGSDAFSFDGRHYQIENLDAQPKPVQSPRPNVIVGGSGGKRSVAIAARWADEYNTVYAGPEKCRKLRSRVSEAWNEAGRDEKALTFSLMTGFAIGSDRADLEARATQIMERNGESGSASAWLANLSEEWIAGTIEEAVDRLGRLAEAGVDRVMLQHQNHADVEMVALAGSVASKLA